MLRGALCIVAAVGLFAPLGWWLHAHHRVSPEEQEALSQAFQDPGLCRPEPGERYAYQAGAVFLTVSLFALAYLVGLPGKAYARPPIRRLRFPCELTVLLLVAALCCWVVLSSRSHPDGAERRYPHLRHPLVAVPLLALPGFGLFHLLARWRTSWRPRVASPVDEAPQLLRRLQSRESGLPRAAFHAGPAIVIACIFLLCQSDQSHGYMAIPHFSAVFFPMVQTYLGGTLLVDCVNQYGLYPELLRPLFQLIGLSVSTFTFVFAVLNAVGFAAVWLFFRRSVRSPVLALIGFFAFAFNGWFYFLSLSRDFYFQYYPVRFLFPALTTLAAWAYLERPGRARYLVAMLLACVGPLWNADSGAPTFAAWLALLLFTALSRSNPGARWRAVAGHLLAAAGCLALVLGAFAATTFLRSGSLPDFGEHVRYQALFYQAGFAMLPMPWPAPWMVVVLVYLAGLAFAARSLAERSSCARAPMALFLSVLGVGLLAYYQGRSHPAVLLLAWWPCFLLLTLLLDELLSMRRAWWPRPLPAGIAALALCYLGGSACALFWCAPALVVRVARLPEVRHGAGSECRQQAEVLEKWLAPGEAVFILTEFDAYLHLVTGRPPLGRCGAIQMLLKADFDRAWDVVRRRRAKVLLAGGPADMHGRLPPGFRLIAGTPKATLLQFSPTDAAADPRDRATGPSVPVR